MPDSFKGTMSSVEICKIMHGSIKQFYPDALVVSLPIADGGEGSVDAFLLAAGGEEKQLAVQGPFGQPVDSFYGILSDGCTAVIEMAAAAGLPLAEGRLNPEKTTTYGAGELIKAALDAGCKKIIMGLGGSATNDGGTGCAAALGIRFYDADGKVFIPAGGTLKNIMRIDSSGVDLRLKDVELVCMCDIDNILDGPTGAAHVFAPQKGADAQIVRDGGGEDFAKMPGAGAAGGMGYGMKTFLNFKLQMGIETVLDTVHFNEQIKDAGMIFTGEGKIDTQSLRGKVVIGIARRAKTAGVPVIAVVGDIGDHIEEAYKLGVSAIFSINRIAADFSKVKSRAPSDMALTMDTIMRFCRISGW